MVLGMPMDLAPSERAAALRDDLLAFMDSHVYPAEATYERQIEEGGDPHRLPPVVEELKAEARERGLWNLFLPDERWGAGLSNLDYAHLAEVTGRSPHIAPESLNCGAPDTGNMEVLAMFGTPEQQEQWLVPLLEGEIRSCFAMTEPEVASSDATNISGSIRREGDEFVIDTRKWFITGAADERCKVALVLGRSNPDGPRHAQHSLVLVPMDAPGVTVVRNMSVFGYTDQHGHVELLLENVRVPASNLVGEEGGGFAIAQARLGPGRIHHCMRAIGMSERAIDLMVDRARTREAFGRPLADQGLVRAAIAESRMQVDQARLLVLATAHAIDTVGARAARAQVAAIKIVAARAACDVIDRAIQVHGGAGVSQDFPLARFYAAARTLRLVDGPDEVHLRTVAKQELARGSRSVSPGAWPGTDVNCAG
jgi:acyl-CoA dehydrogenase